MNRLNLIIALLFCLRIQAQDQKILIRGTIKSKDLPVENIHIINLSSHKGSLSNQYGEFYITVKENDTLFFSGLQYDHLRIIINKKIFSEKEIHVSLTENINQLKEVFVSPYELTGNLTSDSKNYIDTNAKKIVPLRLGDIDFSIPSLSVAKQLDPDNVSVRTDQSIPVGGDILGLLNMITGESISRSLKKKKRKKEQERVSNNKRETALEDIRNELGNLFFTENLHINSKEIDEFILFCKPKGIIDLYLNNKKLEMIDIFFKERNSFISSR